MRNVLALLLLEGFLLAFFLRCGRAARCCWFSHKLVSSGQCPVVSWSGLCWPLITAHRTLLLCFRRRLLLLRDRALARAFAGARVRMSALSADRQVAAMAEAAIGADFDEPFDVHRNFLAQIALDQPLLLNHGTDAVDFFFAEVLDLLHRIHFGLVENTSGARMPDAVDVGQRDVDVLLAR